MEAQGSNEYLANKNLAYLNQGNAGNQKLADLSKAGANQASFNMQQKNEQSNKASELNIPRFDSPSSGINKNPAAFGNPYEFLNIASLMRDERFLGLSGASAGNYYDKNITPAHMFSKMGQQVNSTAALQQMFNNSMTTMAYNTNREQQNVNMNYQNRMGSQASAQMNPASAVAQNNPSVAQLVAAQKQDPKQKKSRKNKNPTPTLQATEPAVNPAMQQQLQQTANNSGKNTGNMIGNQMNTPFPQNLSNQQMAAQQAGFQSYTNLKNTSNVQGTSSEAISLKTASVVPGSAFNFGPGPGLPLPAGIYNPDNSAYLDESRGTENPYYQSSLAFRAAGRESGDSRAIPANPYYQSTFGLGSTPKTAEKSAQPPPAHPPPAASPYHQFLPHPSRPSYPFMNPMDPIYQQHFQRQEELNQMQMINQTYQAGYHLSMHNRSPWM
jgi:hypothetical protein